MEAGRRHEIPGSETNDFITWGSVSCVSFIVMSVPLAFPLQVPWGWHSWLRWMLPLQEVGIKAKGPCA